MLLYPDMSRAQHEADTFCFAAPVPHDEWDAAMQKAERPHKQYLPYYIDKEEDVAIILRSSLVTDDDCLETAAWLRMVQEFRGMIYALPYGSTAPSPPTIGQIILTTAGVDPKQVRYIYVEA